jgi:hypothetical protein
MQNLKDALEAAVPLVFKGPVRSGFLAKNGLTGTVTGPSNLL